MKHLIRSFPIPLLLVIMTACTANSYTVVNTIHFKTKRGAAVAINTAQVGNGRATHENEYLRRIKLGASQTDKIVINVLTTSQDYSPDPALIDLALDNIQKIWGRMGGMREGSILRLPKLSIDFWILPQGASFKHHGESIIDPSHTLDLTFASDFSSDKPAIDGVAEFVNVLSHELYHVSQFGRFEVDSLIEEVNAHAWGYCSKFRFALASGKKMIIRWYVKPSWKDRVRISAGVLMVQVPPNIGTPVLRSQFGLAIFYQYLSIMLDSDSLDASNAKQMTIIEKLCSRIEGQELNIVME
ncbi:MAG: hypothetical protein M9960_11015 [Xanthomonadaceae bacterium]|nr:hypothetical protein [Xanthomonadaceae bacterium]